jgi:hypothetical protein
MQVGIPVLGVVENMSGLSQQLHKFKFFTTSADGAQQDVTQQVLQHLPAELQVTSRTSTYHFVSSCCAHVCMPYTVQHEPQH